MLTLGTKPIDRRRVASAPTNSKLHSSISDSRLITGSLAEYYQLLPKLSPLQIKSLLYTSMQGNWSSWYDLNSLMQDTWPRLAKNLHEIREAVKATRMLVHPFTKPGQDPTPSARAKAQLVQQALDDFNPIPGSDEMGLSDMVYEIAGGLVMPNVQEILWQQTEQAVFAPRATVGVNPREFGFTKSHRLGLRFTPDPADPYNMQFTQDLPADKFIVAIYKTRSGAMTMSGLLRPLAFWWGAMMFGRDWLLRFAELFGQPIRDVVYDRNINPAALTILQQSLEQMGANGWLMRPDGTTFNLIGHNVNAQNNPQTYLIELADKYADLMILGETLTGDAGHNGSRALGDVHHKVRHQRIEAVAAWVAEVLTYQLVRPIMRLNYGSLAECPVVHPDFSEPQMPQEMANTILTLAQAGWQADEAEMNERFNLKLKQKTGDRSQKTE